MMFGAYGKLMLDFQSLELSLWQFLMQRSKSKTTLNQRFRKMEGGMARRLAASIGVSRHKVI